MFCFEEIHPQFPGYFKVRSFVRQKKGPKFGKKCELVNYLANYLDNQKETI